MEKKSRYPEFIEYGRAGGKKRAEKLTPEHRKEIAENAAKKRWEKEKKLKTEGSFADKKHQKKKT